MFKRFIYVSLIFVICISAASCLSERTNNIADSRENKSEIKEVKEKTKTEVSPEEEEVLTETEQQKLDGDQKDSSSDSPKLKEKKGFETRCGWYSNPTPGNHWLTDADGQWIIGVQGGRQAEGDYPPEFSNSQWLATNGYYGYGCACLNVKVDKKEMLILEIADGKARPLSACQNDSALKSPDE